MNSSHKYAVVYKETGKIYKTFEHWGEALYCITDSFGPEGYKVESSLDFPYCNKCGEHR